MLTIEQGDIFFLLEALIKNSICRLIVVPQTYGIRTQLFRKIAIQFQTPGPKEWGANYERELERMLCLESLAAQQFVSAGKSESKKKGFNLLSEQSLRTTTLRRGHSYSGQERRSWVIFLLLEGRLWSKVKFSYKTSCISSGMDCH